MPIRPTTPPLWQNTLDLTAATIPPGSTLNQAQTGSGGGTVTNVTATAPIASSGGTTPNITHDASGVAAGTYGDATHVGAVTVDAEGHVTAASSIAIAGTAPGGTAGGDLSGTYPNPTVAKINTVALGTTTATAGNLLIGSGSAWATQAMSGDATISSGGALTLATVNSNVGTFGDSTHVGTFTVNAKGLITAASNTAIATGTGSPLTTKGDLYTFSTVNTRLPVGANNTLLTPDSAQPTGNKYITVSDLLDAVVGSSVPNLLGRTSAGGGWGSISLGTALSMSGTTLNAGTQPIPSGTSNPVSPSTNDLFWRTDLGFFIYYDGTRWLTFNECASNIYGYSAALPLSASLAGAFRWGTRSDFQAFITRFQITTLINGGTSNSTNKWTANMVQYNAANSMVVTTAVLDTGATPDTVSNWVSHDTALNTPANSGTKQFQLDFTKTGAPGNLFLVTTMYYRLIVT